MIVPCQPPSPPSSSPARRSPPTSPSSPSPCAAAPARVQGGPVRLDVDRRRRRRSAEPHPRRSYSIASQSDAGEVLRFIIRVIPEGKASEFLMSLPLGTVVNMTGPHGFFVLDAGAPGRHRVRRDRDRHRRGDADAGRARPPARERPRGAPLHRPVGRAARRPTCSPAPRSRRSAKRAGAELRIYLTAPGPAWTGGARADHGRRCSRACPSWSRRRSTWSATAP